MKQKIRNHLIKAFIETQEKAVALVQKGEAVLKNKDGSHIVEVVVTTIAAIAIIAVVVVLIIAMLKGDIFPEMGVKIKEIFNMK